MGVLMVLLVCACTVINIVDIFLPFVPFSSSVSMLPRVVCLSSILGGEPRTPAYSSRHNLSYHLFIVGGIMRVPAHLPLQHMVRQGSLSYISSRITSLLFCLLICLFVHCLCACVRVHICMWATVRVLLASVHVQVYVCFRVSDTFPQTPHRSTISY